MDTITFGSSGTPISRARYERISAAHAAHCDAVARAGKGPRDAGQAVSAQIWREHGPRPWTAAELRDEAKRVSEARETHPDYAEWIRLSAELDRRIARNRELGRPLLAYTDADWASEPAEVV